MSCTVLVCDDAGYMRTMITDILTQAGYEVLGEATSGVEAVEKYKELMPDVVTMDIVMPDMSGLDALREIMIVDPNACVVMCSAIGQKALLEQARVVGARGFVVKPFEPDGLLKALNDAVEDV